LAPDFISWMAMTNRKMAATKKTSFSAIRRHGGREARGAAGSVEGRACARSDCTVIVNPSRVAGAGQRHDQFHQVHA
jgi:hypothetical protein